MSTRAKVLLAVLLAAGCCSLVLHQVRQKKIADIEAARLRSEALVEATEEGSGGPTGRRVGDPEQEATPPAGQGGVVGEMPAEAGEAIDPPPPEVEALNEPATGP